MFCWHILSFTLDPWENPKIVNMTHAAQYVNSTWINLDLEIFRFYQIQFEIIDMDNGNVPQTRQKEVGKLDKMM